MDSIEQDLDVLDLPDDHAPIKFDDRDDAAIGHARIFRDGEWRHVLVYSYSKLVENVYRSMAHDLPHDGNEGLTQEDAEEYVQFNIQGLYAGPNTPLIVDDQWS